KRVCPALKRRSGTVSGDWPRFFVPRRSMGTDADSSLTFAEGILHSFSRILTLRLCSGLSFSPACDFQMGLHCLNSLAEPFRKPPKPWLAAVGYTLFGAVAGGLSLLVFPAHLVKDKSLRMVSLVATPFAVGFV